MTTFKNFFNKWMPFLKKGFLLLPVYFRHHGARKSLVRFIKVLIGHGMYGLHTDFKASQEFFKHVYRKSQPPDYVIVAPDYVSVSAGVQCLYRLCADLATRGYEAAIYGSSRPSPYYATPFLSANQALKAAKNGACIIYPETVKGNPLGAKHIIRWVLNRPGLLGGDANYEQNEHIFIYSDVYSSYVKNKVVGKLHMPTLDSTIFFPPKEDDNFRFLKCFYIGKSTYKKGHINPQEFYEITRHSPQKKDLGKIFRNSQVLYCFDNSTALIYEAILCGCPVVIIPDGTTTWQDYEKLELGTHGIYWGAPPKIPPPVKSHNMMEKLKKIEVLYDLQLQYFIEYTQNLRINSTKNFNISLRSLIC